MVERPHRREFTLIARRRGCRRGPAGPDRLDGHVPLRVRVPRAVHDALRTTPEFLDEVETAKCAERFRLDDGAEPLHPDFRGFVVGKPQCVERRFRVVSQRCPLHRSVP